MGKAALLLLYFFVVDLGIASDHPEDLCQSWMPAKTTPIEGAGELVLLSGIEDPSEVPGLVEFEACLMTYVRLVIQEKQYPVSQEHRAALNKFQTFALADACQYQRQAKFSTIANAVLPDKNRTLLGYIRLSVAYFYPSIHMHEAIQAVRAVSPLAADYLDYLFKVHSGEGLLERMQLLAQQVHTRRPHALDMMALFAMHVFGHFYTQNLTLSEKASFSLGSMFKSKSAPLIYDIMHDVVVIQKYEKPRLALKSSAEFFDYSDLEARDLNIFSDEEALSPEVVHKEF